MTDLRKKWLSLARIFVFGLWGFFTLPAMATEAPVKTLFPVDVWQELLEAYVDEKGYVAYARLKEHREILDSLLSQLSDVDKSALKASSRDEQIAFWIDAYNALVIKSVVKHYPIKERFFSFHVLGVWHIPNIWSRKHDVAGEEISLKEIQRRLTHKPLLEPRIHFALNCASKSCPRLSKTPYSGTNLEARLRQQSEDFFSSANGLVIDRENKNVRISELFDWYGDEFEDKYSEEHYFKGMSDEKNAGLNYISQHVNEDMAEYLKKGEYVEVDFIDYDWTLNDQKEIESGNP